MHILTPIFPKHTVNYQGSKFVFLSGLTWRNDTW